MKLAIVIPALNEEASVASIVERTLAAREHILGCPGVDRVEVTLVSDGSTDRTVEIARRYEPEIAVIVFERNQGYGAAIRTGWAASDAELLGFLDADGTCDPLFFRELCAAVIGEGADIALGNRLNADSRMPSSRRFGNVLFGALLSLIAARRVDDTASGMRVVRRGAAAKLGRLPSGLHFTPAMSARALLRDDVVVRELPMPYEERVGRSKLRPVRDGLRFLATFLDATLLFRPSRPLGVFAGVAGVIAVLVMIGPVVHYSGHRRVEEWMIYRFVAAHLLGLASLLGVGFAYLMDEIVRLAGALPRARSGTAVAVAAFLRGSASIVTIVALILAAGGLIGPSLRELVVTGATYEHWSRFVVASFAGATALVLGLMKLLQRSLDLLAEQQGVAASASASESRRDR